MLSSKLVVLAIMVLKCFKVEQLKAIKFMNYFKQVIKEFDQLKRDFMIRLKLIMISSSIIRLKTIKEQKNLIIIKLFN